MTKENYKINDIDVTEVRGTVLALPDWFLRKNNVACTGSAIQAIVKETEKAYYAIVGSAFGTLRTIWCPKSLVQESEGYNDCYFICNDWNLALDLVKREADLYR